MSTLSYYEEQRNKELKSTARITQKAQTFFSISSSILRAGRGSFKLSSPKYLSTFFFLKGLQKKKLRSTRMELL
jgi:hypothetical protein